MDSKTAKAFWATGGGAVLLALAGPFFGFLDMSTVLLVAIFAGIVASAMGMAQFAWWHWPSVRARREFKEMAPDLEKASADLVGVLDAQIVQGQRYEERVNTSYARLQMLLARLNQQFGISIETDPFDLIHPKEHAKYVRVVACAHAGDVVGARQVFGQNSAAPRRAS